jgi:hypothetical protein
MSEQGETAYPKGAQWRKDVLSFLAAMWRHWRWWVCQILGSAIGVLLRAGGVMIPGWILWAIAFSGVVMASFLTWRDQKQLAEAAEAKLQRATTIHTEEKRALQERIRLLSSTKESEEKTAFLIKFEKEIMANQLANLETRIGEICSMSGVGYKNSKTVGRDAVTIELLDTIASFLKEHVSLDSAVLFTSKTGVKYTPVPGEGFFGYEEEGDRHAVIDHLNHYAAQLKEILKNY